MFFDIDRDQKKSLQFVLRKANAFCIALDRFLQQKEFIEVRLLYGFRQDCRKTISVYTLDIKKNRVHVRFSFSENDTSRLLVSCL